MKQSLMTLLLLYLIICLGGCAIAYGPDFQVMPEKGDSGVVYLYRLPTISGSFMSSTPQVTVDGDVQGYLKNGGYLPIRVEPGEHQLNIKNSIWGLVQKGDGETVTFSIAKGETKYFEFAIVTTGYDTRGHTEVAKLQSYLLEVAEDIALNKLEKTNLSR